MFLMRANTDFDRSADRDRWVDHQYLGLSGGLWTPVDRRPATSRLKLSIALQRIDPLSASNKPGCGWNTGVQLLDITVMDRVEIVSTAAKDRGRVS